MIFRFGVFELDEEAGELRKSGEPVALQPKPLALLALLIRERERIVPTDELLESLWPGTIVAPGSLTRAVSHARRAIDDTHRGAMLRSHPRRGYRFCGDVFEVSDPSADPSAKVGRAGATESPSPIRPEGFVGREEALQRLHRTWSDVHAGRGGNALITGPAGIGKTRLTEVFAEQLASRGALVVVARARDGEGVPAFWIWAQVLRRLLSEADLADELQELAHSGELASLISVPEATKPTRVADADLSPEERRFLFFDAVTRALTACSRRRRLVLVLEDLQWATPSSLRLLEHLALELADAPLLLVCTVREEPRERRHPVDRTIAVLRHGDRCAQMSLAGLSRGDVAALLAEAIGRPAPADLTSELFARTEGVPLFIREALRVLAERGALRQPERVPSRGMTLPGDAIELISRSLDALSERCADVLEVAAVLGREFPLSLLSAVADVARGEVLDLLDEAVRAGVVEEDASAVASYRFAHALFQDAVYDGMPAGRRARLHLRAAERLESQHAENLDHVAAELAEHRHKSIAVGDPDEAFVSAKRAAARAARIYAYEQSAGHYQQALEALDHCEEVDHRRRFDTLLALGDACRLAGDRPRRLDAYDGAMETARSLGWSLDFARAAIGYCDLSEWSPQDDHARVSVEHALGELGDEHAPENARLLARQAYIEVTQREVAEPISRRAVEVARSSGDLEALHEAQYMLHYIIAGPDALDERRAIIGELAEAARGCRFRDTAVIALLDSACDCLSLGHLDDAQVMREQAGDLAGRSASPSMKWHIEVYDAGMALIEGRFDEMERRTRDAYALGRRIEHPYAKACLNGHLVMASRERGDSETVLQIFGPARSGRIGPTHWVKAVVGRAEFASGDEAAASASLEDLALHDFQETARNMRWTATTIETALLCAEVGDAERARLLLPLLETVEQQHAILPVPINYGGPASRAMARLYELLGQGDEACQLFDEALDAADDLGARPTVARTLLESAPLLMRRGETGRARDGLRESARLAEEMAMAAVAARAREVLART